jgi:hypothetical protein
MIEHFTREHLVQADPKTKQIATSVELIPPRLLWRHIIVFTLEHTLLCVAVALARLSDPKVNELHRPLIRDQDVLRADIAVNHVERAPLLIIGVVCVM